MKDASKTTESLLCMLAPAIYLGSLASSQAFYTANTVEGLVKFLHRCLEVWHFGPNPNFSQQIYNYDETEAHCHSKSRDPHPLQKVWLARLMEQKGTQVFTPCS